ncbi:hypothetical protein LIN78_14185 [Leeia sp. TBRC 13508]|uniref:Uncharacterized protein n=1 Tax=Leeia speluncae TaxID=2884804 RepID=A0ABS8D9J3_9NEIS|nr:hypothetical protein [Leeia speluncae]MCB6184693.1 hypothetical protein [Leeia speluncae]
MQKAWPEANWYAYLCSKKWIDCSETATNNETPKSKPNLLTIKNAQATSFYVITDDLNLLQLSFQNGDWSLEGKWDFSKIAQDSPFPESDDRIRKYIFPALYPIGPNRFSVALIQSWSEGYSGGGGHWEIADFYEIKGKNDIAKAPTYSNVPFSCQKDLRACFTEEEYNHSPHCREEFTGSLRLQYETTKTENYHWKATWQSYHWAGGEPKKNASNSKTAFKLLNTDKDNLKRYIEKIGFCEPVEFE